MATIAWSVVHPALQYLTSTICRANEATLISNQWIITAPPVAANRAPAIVPYQRALTTLVYAVSEPLCTKLFLRFPDPWVNVMALSMVHLWIGSQVMEPYVDVLISQWTPELKATIKEAHAQGRVSNFSTLPGWQLELQFLSLVPVITAAIDNAALICFFQSLYAPSISQRWWGQPYFWTFGVLCYLGSRFGDFLVSQGLQRPALVLWQNKRELGISLLYLLALIAVRAGVRALLGQDQLIAVRPLPGEETEKLFGQERYEEFSAWWEDLAIIRWYRALPAWVKLGIIPFLGPVLMLGGNWLMQREAEKERLAQLRMGE